MRMRCWGIGCSKPIAAVCRKRPRYLRTGIDHSDKKNKPWARGFQLGALIYNDDPGAHRELARVANEMRKKGEALDNNLKLIF